MVLATSAAAAAMGAASAVWKTGPAPLRTLLLPFVDAWPPQELRVSQDARRAMKGGGDGGAYAESRVGTCSRWNRTRQDEREPGRAKDQNSKTTLLRAGVLRHHSASPVFRKGGRIWGVK